MRSSKILAGGAFLLALILAAGWWYGDRAGWWLASPYVATEAKEDLELEPTPPSPPKVKHLPAPESVKALYMTQCAAATPSLTNHLLALASSTEINSIVIDLKDYSGTVSFPSATAVAGGPGCTIPNFAELIEKMHDQGLYVIGRLTVFQDPLFTKVHPELAVQSKSRGGPWKDRKGLSFVDVGARPFWTYIESLAGEAYELGVDEINFDYIRYPSDGDMSDTEYAHSVGPKAEMLEQFFQTLTSSLRSKFTNPPIILSADLFGMTATNYDDLNIGQVLERALPHFDYIAPMVYPSHYPKNFNGWTNPNEHAYDIIFYSMSRAAERAVATTTPVAGLTHTRLGTSTPPVYAKTAYSKKKLRPWLQDFDYPVTYTPEMVRAQIQATYDAGLDSWMMWDPANRYTSSVYQAE